MASILLADDVAFSREALARALRERGHRVVVAADGQEAVERFARERPDLVILDVMMPRMGGLAACKRIKAAGGFVPTIVISGRADLETRLSALALAEDFVAKPYDIPELVARVEAQLRTRRAIEGALAAAAPSSAVPPGSRPAEEPAPEARSSGNTTSLPRLLERDAFREHVTEEVRRAARGNDPLALVLAAADAPVNGGEPASSLMASALQRSLHGQHAITRIDDTQVAGLLLATHVTGAMAAAERFRKELRRIPCAPTICMGFTFYPSRDVAEPLDLMRAAEKALARAREQGPGHVFLLHHQGYLFQPSD